MVPILLFSLLLLLPYCSTYTPNPSAALTWLESYTSSPLPPTLPRSTIMKTVLEAVEEKTRSAVSTPHETDVPFDLQMLTPAERTMSVASTSRTEMSIAYSSLLSVGALRKYGLESSSLSPSSPSTTVLDFEASTSLPISSLAPPAPSPTDPYLALGVGLAILEVYLSLTMHVPFSTFFILTLAPLTLERFFLNGAISDSLLLLLVPGRRRRIARHEAGHFLISYLLGCPIEAVALTSLDALLDERFGGLSSSVSAGVSFYDPGLTGEIGEGRITRKTIDRYSAVVMGGVASEALEYGGAEGGKSDEQVRKSLLPLVYFFLSLASF